MHRHSVDVNRLKYLKQVTLTDTIPGFKEGLLDASASSMQESRDNFRMTMKSSKNKSSQFPKENRLPLGLIKSQSSSKESENKESSHSNDLLVVRG